MEEPATAAQKGPAKLGLEKQDNNGGGAAHSILVLTSREVAPREDDRCDEAPQVEQESDPR